MKQFAQKSVLKMKRICLTFSDQTVKVNNPCRPKRTPIRGLVDTKLLVFLVNGFLSMEYVHYSKLIFTVKTQTNRSLKALWVPMALVRNFETHERSISKFAVFMRASLHITMVTCREI